MVDYSRWDNLQDSDDEREAAATAILANGNNSNSGSSNIKNTSVATNSGRALVNQQHGNNSVVADADYLQLLSPQLIPAQAPGQVCNSPSSLRTAVQGRLCGQGQLI